MAYVDVESENGELGQLVPVDVQEGQVVQIQDLGEVVSQDGVILLLFVNEIFLESIHHLIEGLVLVSHMHDLKFQ